MPQGSLWMGTPNRFERIPKFGPQVAGGLDQILKTVLPQALGQTDPSAGFDPIAQAEVQRFRQDIVPSIRERLTGMNLGGGRSSGGLEALGAAGTTLATNLAAQRAQYGLQRQSQLQNLLQMGLQPRDQIGYFGARPGLAQTVLPGLAQAAGKFGLDYLSGNVKSPLGKGLGAAGTGASLGGAVGGPVGAAVGGGIGIITQFLPKIMSLLKGKGGSVSA